MSILVAVVVIVGMCFAIALFSDWVEWRIAKRNVKKRLRWIGGNRYGA